MHDGSFPNARFLTGRVPSPSIPVAADDTVNLRFGNTLAILAPDGNSDINRPKPLGILFNDMRHGGSSLTVNGKPPRFARAEIDETRSILTSYLEDNKFQIKRTLVLSNGVLHEKLTLTNPGTTAQTATVAYRNEADFKDIFDIRSGDEPPKPGDKIPERGEIGKPTVTAGANVTFSYSGVDGKTEALKTVIRSDRNPDIGHLDAQPKTSSGIESYTVTLAPGASTSLHRDIVCLCSDNPSLPVLPPADHFETERRAVPQGRLQQMARLPSITLPFSPKTAQEIHRASADFTYLILETEHGPYVCAGAPWYSTPFGRDGIITAMLMLWADPSIANGTLRYLAATQATHFDDKTAAEPGKIMHEMRKGEKCLLGELPFGKYYGSVDSTPLFVMLAGAYFERTNDHKTIQTLWPEIVAAMNWITEYGQPDEHGFLRYALKSENGLANQGWKDSKDSVFHADGTLAEKPVALCEVQAYAWRALRDAAVMADFLGHTDDAAQWRAKAEALRENIETHFWRPELGTYALAIDKHGNHCDVISSNPGHMLWTGVVSEEHAQSVADVLIGDDMWTEWGIRTIAEGQGAAMDENGKFPEGKTGFHYTSYHNGSIWSHDNALIGLGFGHYGRTEDAAKVFDATIRVSKKEGGVAELVCVDPDHPEKLTAYLDDKGVGACKPQAWSAAAPYGLLQACLGLEINARENTIAFNHPCLPASLSDITLTGLKIDAERSVDVRLQGEGRNVRMEILSNRNNATVHLLKDEHNMTATRQRRPVAAAEYRVAL